MSGPYPDGLPARTVRCTIVGFACNPPKCASTLGGSHLRGATLLRRACELMVYGRWQAHERKWWQYGHSRCLMDMYAEERLACQARKTGSCRERCGELLDGSGHLEDGQIHNNNDGTDDDTHGKQEHRFNPGGHAREFQIQTAFIEFGDVAQHGFKRAGFFADGNHLRREFRQNVLRFNG